MLSVALITESECFRVVTAYRDRRLMHRRIAAIAPAVFADAPEIRRAFSFFRIFACVFLALAAASFARLIAIKRRIAIFAPFAIDSIFAPLSKLLSVFSALRTHPAARLLVTVRLSAGDAAFDPKSMRARLSCVVEVICARMAQQTMPCRFMLRSGLPAMNANAFGLRFCRSHLAVMTQVLVALAAQAVPLVLSNTAVPAVCVFAPRRHHHRLVERTHSAVMIALICVAVDAHTQPHLAPRTAVSARCVSVGALLTAKLHVQRSRRAMLALVLVALLA